MALVGVVARPHGIRGQIVVNAETDFPEVRFQPGAELFLVQGPRARRVIVASCRMHLGRPVIGIEGVDSMTAARELAGCELRVPAEALAPLSAGQFYRHDLIGCAVATVSGVAVGTVRRIEGSEGNSRLVVDTPLGEVLIPLAEPICVSIDVSSRTVVIDPPEGLLDLNRRRGA